MMDAVVVSSGLFTLFVILLSFLLLFKRKGHKSWKEYSANKKFINLFLQKQTRKVKTCDTIERKDLSPIDIGLIPSPIEYELENPCKGSFEHSDGIHFVGISPNENMIDICINKIEENVALVWLYLKLSEHKIYKLPFDCDTRKAYIASEYMFSSSGLQIKCLSPMRKWRISFNGLLQECNTDCKDEGELIYCKFSFIWLAMSSVHELNLANNAEELATAWVAPHAAKESDLICIHKLKNKYEQWGQMRGTITFTGEDSKELDFWSARTRIMDSPLWDKEIQYAKLYIYFLDGVPLKVESVSVKELISNLVSGYSTSTYGGIKLISNCSFNIEMSKENEISFTFNLNDEKKRLQLHLAGKSTTFSFGPKLLHQLVLKPFKVNMNNDYHGYGILHYSSMLNKENSKDFQQPPLLLTDIGDPSCERFVLSLEEEACRSSNIAGGKGSSLALLTALSKNSDQFVVPRGFVISTKAFEDHLKINEKVNNAICRLRDVACKKIKADLKTECDICMSEFQSTHLSDYLKKEILGNLVDAYVSLENIRFSVRSSAYGEDSEDLSAAGQMLTVLGIRRIDNVFEAIIECWSSKFSFEYVQYCRQNGQSILSPMAVVVQEMVPSAFSGVMFTVDPVTGNPSHPYITANYGLGETVVSALADPDTVILKRDRDNNVQVFKVSVGSKRTQVFMKDGDTSGVEQKNFENHSQFSCLTDEWATKIGNVGILVESCYCSPRDIEWAVHKNQLYLLQARPITTLHNETDFELIHDQDTPVQSVNDFWTRANTGEVFLGATSPLGISIVVAGMDIFNHKNHVISDKCFSEYCPYYFHILPITHRQVTLNLVDTFFRQNEKEISPIQRAFEVALFGRIVISKEVHQAAVKKYGYASKLKKYLGWLFIIKVSHDVPKSIRETEKEILEYRTPFENYTTSKKTWNGILEQMDILFKAYGVHGMATFLSSYYNMMVMTILSKGKKDWDTELYCDFASMLSSCSDVVSADVPESLQELAKTIAKEHGNTFSALPVNVALNLLKNDNGTAGKLFETFLQKHGHRCVKEFDIFTKSWGMQPENLIPTLQNLVSSPNILNTTHKEVKTAEAILSEIKTPVTTFNKLLLKFLLPRCRTYVSERERTKSMIIKMVDWFRKTCYHLGDLMVQEGLLPESELVFFLTMEEIKEMIDFQKPGLVPKAQRRMRLHPNLNDLKFPEIMKGIPKPVQMQTDFTSYSSSFTLKGTPVCQGTVKGKAVVVLNLDDASNIKNGDILITHATDIGWSPYFPMLSGVVTVLGGLISHGLFNFLSSAQGL